MTDITTDLDLPDDYARVHCACPFVAVGPAETVATLYDDHRTRCPQEPQRPPAVPDPWYAHVLGLFRTAIWAGVTFTLIVYFFGHFPK